MTQAIPALYLDEIDARIAEAKRYGASKAAEFATWQRAGMIRQYKARMKLEERKARAAIAKSTTTEGV